jgi:hypothetical protein
VGIRYATARLAASTIAIAASLLSVTAPAYANQLDSFYIVNSSGARYYLVDIDGYAAVSQPITGGDDFANINGSKWDGRPVYEWQDTDLTTQSYCLTVVSMETVQLLPCFDGDNAQLWWQTGEHLINVSTGYCMNADHASDGSRVDVIACKTASQPGYFDQDWISQS